MISENLSTLKINKLTQEQYDRELAANNLSSSELYLTPVGDHVIEQGTSGVWYYRKWASGIAECWTESQQSYTGTLTSNLMGGYCYYVDFTLPFTFASMPVAWGNGKTSTGVGFAEVTPLSTTVVRLFVIGNANSTQINNAYVNVKGRWK